MPSEFDIKTEGYQTPMSAFTEEELALLQEDIELMKKSGNDKHYLDIDSPQKGLRLPS